MCLFGGCSHRDARHVWRVARPGVALRAPVVAQPVRSARAWATALVPNRRGQWTFITQLYEYESSKPSEFVVVDLATGKQTTYEGPTGIYTNSNYQLDEQLRARNGRVFFPELDNRMAYFDPTTEAVAQLPAPIVPPGDDKAIYRVVFGPDGKLYGGTQSTGLPTVFTLDPDTLKAEVIGHVGRDRHGYSYAYYLAADPPWLYVEVGEAPWELVAIHLKTHEMRVLATRPEGGWMQLDPRAGGIVASLISDLRTPRQRTDLVWCVDGAIVPVQPGAAPPFTAHQVQPLAAPIERAPEIDRTRIAASGDGRGRVRWRGRGDAWREVSYRARYTSPIPLESLLALPDGTLLGNARQYHGFFRFDPRTRTTTDLGPFGISGGPRLAWNRRVYLAGYPNGGLYEYDPTAPWDARKNPRHLGDFTQAGTHYAYFLEPSPWGRLYYAGRRERVGVGGGVGFYDPATAAFGGHHDGLSFLSPQGLAVLGASRRVVYSGRLGDDPAQAGKTPSEAQLVVYDADLREVWRRTVIPGLANTGLIFAAQGDVVVGIVADAQLAYRYDVARGTLLAKQELGGPVFAVARRDEDGSLWMIRGRELVRLDPQTLELRSFGTLPETPPETTSASILAWVGDRLYWAVGSELREIEAPDS